MLLNLFSMLKSKIEEGKADRIESERIHSISGILTAHCILQGSKVVLMLETHKKNVHPISEMVTGLETGNALNRVIYASITLLAAAAA